MNKTNAFISLLLILISLAWAGSFVAVKITVEGDGIPGVDIGFLRFFVATPLMVLILFFRKKNKYIPLKEFPSLAVLGLTGVTLIYVFQFTGIELTTASTSAVLVNTNVIFILILSIIFLKEKLTMMKGIGVTFSFCGVITVVFAQMMNEHIDFTNTFLLGCFLVISSAFCWAIYSIVGKKLLQKYDGFTVTTYAFVLGTLFYLPIVIQRIPQTVQKISFDGWMAVLYLALLCSVFGYLGWYYVLNKIEAGRSAVFLNLIPLFAIIISFFFGEHPTSLFIFGAMLIIYGVYLTQKT